MIKASALLAAVAIGLLVAGVLASSLLMVYVSIAVCAVAALILAVGILTHWPEIFGGGEARQASAQGAWSAPQVQVSTPVLASAQAAAPAGREDRRPRREEAGGRPAVPPAEVVPPQEEYSAAGRGDDLWERVEEELGSAGKRDTGALSWPATEIPVLREPPGPPVAAGPAGQAGPQGAPPAGASAWIWGPGAGWRPPETPDPSWPPPAADFAGPSAPPEQSTPDADRADADRADADRADADSAAVDSPEPDAPDAAGAASADTGQAAEPAANPVPAAAAAEPSQEAQAARPGSPGDDSAGPAPEDEAAGPTPGDEAAGPTPGDEAAAPGDEAGQAAARPARPQWIISLPDPESPAADLPSLPDEAAAGDAAVTDEDAAAEPADEEPVAQEPAGQEPAAQEPDAQEPAAEGPEAGGQASENGPGQVQVTIVPGVARYHRSECILIRFLGAGDLEILTRQEAEEAKFVACRACQPDQLEA